MTAKRPEGESRNGAVNRLAALNGNGRASTAAAAPTAMAPAGAEVVAAAAAAADGAEVVEGAAGAERAAGAEGAKVAEEADQKVTWGSWRWSYREALLLPRAFWKALLVFTVLKVARFSEVGQCRLTL